jgi:plasmid replication initiation protein
VQFSKKLEASPIHYQLAHKQQVIIQIHSIKLSETGPIEDSYEDAAQTDIFTQKLCTKEMSALFQRSENPQHDLSKQEPEALAKHQFVLFVQENKTTSYSLN